MMTNGENMQGSDDEKLGLFGLALGFTVAFVLMLILNVTGVMSAIFAQPPSHVLWVNIMVLHIFGFFMTISYLTPKRWIFGKNS